MTQVKFLHKDFPGGKNAVQNTSHQRRPRTNITPENIAVLRDLIESDRRLTVVDIFSGAWYAYQLWERVVHHQIRVDVSKNFGPMRTQAVE